MFKLTEQEIFEAEGSTWYENDLQLAAELGKTLLERNKDLESQLRQANLAQFEQTKEIELLTKQLEVLRSVNDSRMRIYEDVDKNLQDSDKANEKLHQDLKAEREKVKSLQTSIHTLEQRCEELQAKNDDLREQQLLAAKERKEAKRTHSVPSLHILDLCDTDFTRGFGFGEFNGLPAYERDRKNFKYKSVEEKQIVELRDLLKQTRAQLKLAQDQKHALESEISSLVADNNELQNKITEYETEQKRIRTLESELKSLELGSGSICKLCGDHLQQSESYFRQDSEDIAIEHDLQELPRGRLVRLKNGGSAFGSRESLNHLGLEVEDDALALEISDITYEDLDGRSKDGSPDAEWGSKSILGEMEDQYRSLVKKYESLIESKAKRKSVCMDVGTQDDLMTPSEPDPNPAPTCIRRPKKLPIPGSDGDAGGGSNRNSLDLTSPMTGHFEKGPPEYTRLFQEIFQTLRRSVVYEDSPSPKEEAAAANQSG